MRMYLYVMNNENIMDGLLMVDCAQDLSLLVNNNYLYRKKENMLIRYQENHERKKYNFKKKEAKKKKKHKKKKQEQYYNHENLQIQKQGEKNWEVREKLCELSRAK